MNPDFSSDFAFEIELLFQVPDDASAGGDKVVDGDLFRATYIESNRSTVDSKALFAELGATPEQIARHTKVTAVFSVKVTSK